ncbi:SDR family NAD(P)-dependent oxidoreductase [Goodfellowiella coeruleoviolacea]|uniref:NADP-dependent 3-hydroxy acid dehydrogenase YdfG n=1 Tax=Goodfellowiella coeruleoviolacea TaxID=334858 RepID=A0AAE3GKK2_9PSEU|nr:SDR family NAD(P)-dependent oxidoreductase [Goodfellowiella coeruleoviolacea]MCP2169094.1 NADP-dependent 3-hydroxy acid dehydrogenase YdfG [Goodfellowiella coeruleoviolacea]
MPGVVIIGAGPGIGRSVARRFAREGLPVTLVARSADTVAAVADALAPTGVRVLSLTADSTDATALRAALDTASEEFGVPDVVVYNAAIIQPDLAGELSVRAHQDAWAVNVVGAINTAAHVAPAMARRGSGSFLITGGMPEPKPEYVSLSLGKAGVRALVALLDKQYGPAGLHVASVTVDGPVAPGTDFDPDDIAEHYWYLHTQPRHQWDREIVHSEHAHRRSGDAHDWAHGVLIGLLGAWQSAFDEQRWHDLAALFTEDALFQGIDPALRVGPTETVGYYAAVTDQPRAAMEVLRANRLAEGLVGGFADVTFTPATGEPRSIRLSVVAQRIEGTWRIRQYHAAPRP